MCQHLLTQPITDGLPIDGRDILGREVYEDSASPECLDVAVEWLRTCRGDHNACRQIWRPVEDYLPTRVIEVGDESCYPKLIDTKGRLGDWVALSYCWGGNSPFVLNATTAKDLKRGVPLGNFPATLRDAIIITRRLGIKYLWIDALCIQQDSGEDWAAEAAKMREVYAGALLTIAAAHSTSTNAGIFSQRKSRDTHVCLDWKAGNHTTSTVHTVYLRPGSELWDDKLQSSALMSRGWTLQEGLLAPRTLSYGLQQMIWECSTHQADESGRITIPTQDYRGKLFIQSMIEGRSGTSHKWKKYEKLFSWPNLPLDGKLKLKSPQDPYERWYNIVQEFTRRSLTKDTDSLPALAGLARQFQRVTKDVYCAGLWKKDIIHGLLWVRLAMRSKDGTTRWDTSKPTEYLAPSWSWAGVLGKQTNFYNWRARDTLSSKLAVSVAEVIEVRTVLKGLDKFGQVISGKITLKARFYQLAGSPTNVAEDESSDQGQTCTVPDTSQYVEETSAFLQYVHRAFRDTGRIEYEFLQQHVPTPNQTFAILELIRWAQAPGGGVPGMEFMALESTGKRDNEYRRIGLFALRKESVPNQDAVGPDAYNGVIAKNKAWAEVINAGWKKRTVTII